MNIKTLSRTVIAMFCCLLFLNTHAQKIRLTDKKSNLNAKEFKKILIVGVGSISSRVFLENLSNTLIEYFKKKNIDAEYLYLGKKEMDYPIDIKNIQTKEFDALLVFDPLYTEIANVGAKSLDSIPKHGAAKITSTLLFGGTSSTYMYYVNYKEEFNISFYETIALSNSVWEASLKLNCDFSEDKTYKNASNKIITNMQKNFLLTAKHK